VKNAALSVPVSMNLESLALTLPCRSETR
jgi:hypothetical protein